MTNMERRCSLSERRPLAVRDGLLSRLARAEWPFAPLLDLLDLPASADVLDVGAGDGRWLGALRAKGHSGRRQGLDPSPGSLEILTGAAHALPFAEETFDVVTLVRVLGHLPDAGAALAEARRVVRPGGWVVLAAHGGEHLRATRQILGHLPDGPGLEAALREALTQAGWVARRLDARLPVTLTAADAEVLVRVTGRQDDVRQGAFPVRDILHLAVYVARR